MSNIVIKIYIAKAFIYVMDKLSQVHLHSKLNEVNCISPEINLTLSFSLLPFSAAIKISFKKKQDQK